MTPQLERPEPPYMQLVRHFRDVIKRGDLPTGTRLPAAREIADEWGVAFTTVGKAFRRLAADGFVQTTNQGTTVIYANTSTYSPADRLASMRGTGRIYPISERAVIVDAGLVDPPEYVAEAMDLEAGAKVIRRERITYHGELPVTASISWMPGDLIEQVPELAQRGRIPGGTVGLVAERTGRTVARDTYRECARRATEVDAERLDVEAGDPVLYGQNTWYQADGRVLEFGEYVIGPERWVTVGED